MSVCVCVNTSLSNALNVSSYFGLFRLISKSSFEVDDDDDDDESLCS